MGFLDVNVTKKRNKRNTRSAPKKKIAKYRSIINEVPSEILQSIFVLSGNLDFPQTSPIVARKLKRTPSLLTKFVRSQIGVNGLPVGLIRLPYITADLLASLNVSVDCEYIPKYLESFEVDRNRALVQYMLQRGHKPENSMAMYRRAISSQDWELATQLTQFGHRCSVESVFAALNADQFTLAQQMTQCVDSISAENVIRLRQLGLKL